MTTPRLGFIATDALETYAELPPLDRLRPHVDCVWTSRNRVAVLKRIVPDGCVDLIWSPDPGWSHGVSGGDDHTGDIVHLAGPDTREQLARLPPGQVFGLRLRPGRAAAVVGVPAEDLRDRRLDLAAVWGDRRAARLVGAIRRAYETSGGSGVAGVLQDEVARRLAAEAPDRVVAGLVAELATAVAPVNVADFAGRAGISDRQMLRRCRVAVGYGPKTLDRVLRFQRFVELGHRRPGERLAAIAASSGYFDQAHLVRECRTLAGVTPSELLTGTVRAA
jgi:AraC-like DNA-binding protein